MRTDDQLLVRTVAQDLRFLQTSWNQAVDEASLRRDSAVLRRLLAHGDYSRAWRVLGFAKEPKVIATDLLAHLGSYDQKHVIYAQAGGARVSENNGFQGEAFQMVVTDSHPDTIKTVAGPGKARSTEIDRSEYGLTRYLDSPSIIIQGLKISRREVIQYVANRLGGAHLDTRRDPQKAEDMKAVALDNATNTFELLEKPAIYFELLAIGQTVSNSKDANRFLAEARNVFG